MSVVIGKQYRWRSSEDCGSNRNGALVTVLETYDCLDCWWVRCKDGHEFQAFGDELYPLDDGETAWHQPDFIPGDCVVRISTGEKFRIAAIEHGRLILSNLFVEGGYGFVTLAGTFDPTIFRRTTC